MKVVTIALAPRGEGAVIDVAFGSEHPGCLAASRDPSPVQVAQVHLERRGPIARPDGRPM